ncbi:hypothetical protein MKZ25_02390 [Solibacillus sp. FSL W7-1464]|uniref:hypothetical protein n=1 Tax=Solibacillus sp. FSL W7-1464 TaxID=2921706 RepID=UPI0030FA7862
MIANNIEENLLLYCSLYNPPERTIGEAKRRGTSFQKGMMQRVILAFTIMHNVKNRNSRAEVNLRHGCF